MVQKVLTRFDPRTEEEVLGTAQAATQHSHLESPETLVSAKNVW